MSGEGGEIGNSLLGQRGEPRGRGFLPLRVQLVADFRLLLIEGPHVGLDQRIVLPDDCGLEQGSHIEQRGVGLVPFFGLLEVHHFVEAGLGNPLDDDVQSVQLVVRPIRDLGQFLEFLDERAEPIMGEVEPQLQVGPGRFAPQHQPH